ncbi:MAG: toll/interleukin-1 receptor domain-containing protein [Verrucomicrobiaceae bacterium]|nr:toll/interleukin-1 receptor domain-containing protein [Verrucomicrobiaceae bacterium]
MTNLSKNDTPTKDVFISYNRADEAWAKKLAERLESIHLESTPTGRSLSVFFAPWDIEYGSNFVNTLNDGLRAARYFVPIMTPEFFGSDWTNLEWTDQVALDPRNASGRILPIFLRAVSLDGKRRITIPPPFNVLNRFDFRDTGCFDTQFDELVRVIQGLPKKRGSTHPSRQIVSFSKSISGASHLHANPDQTDELLLMNLVEIISGPDEMWIAPTKARKRNEVWSSVKTNEAFVLRSDSIMAFCNMADAQCSLYPIVEPGGKVRSMSRVDVISDADGRRTYVEMLNECLRAHCRERKIGIDSKGRYYFWPNRNEAEELCVREHSFRSEKPREVAAPKTRPDTEEQFWVHYAARMRFEFLGDRLFLRIDPSYIFTSDGRNPLDSKATGRLSIQWTGKQQNPDLLRLMLFWIRVLADGKPEVRIAAGGSFIKAKAFPASSSAHFGVTGDYIRIQALLQGAEPTLDDIVDELTETEDDDLQAEDEEDLS